jgi:ribosomal protein L16 Arg81 hydroxylase
MTPAINDAAACGTRPTLGSVLSPVDPGTFLDEYFERQPLHVGRDEPRFFAGVYDVAELEAALVVGSRNVEQFAMTKGGATLDRDEMTIERRSIRSRYTGKPPVLVIDPRAVAARFESGYTLLIKDAASFSPRLQALCNRLQTDLGCYVQANVYFTPPRAQGFALHHDTHDTLILQIEGTKKWNVFEPAVELPIETQPYSKAEHGSCSGAPREIALAPGDTLYLPRGFRHEAATAENRSLHVTLALLPLRVIDLVESALQFAAVSQVELRRALPPGWHLDPAFPDRFAARIAEQLARELRGACVRAARDLVCNDAFAVTRTVADEIFANLDRLARATPESSVSLRDESPFMVRDRRTSIQVVAAGKAVSLPASCAPVLERLRRGPATVAEVDRMLPDAGRSLLAMLVTDGIVAIGAT